MRRNLGHLLKMPHIFTKVFILALFLILGGLFFSSKVHASGNHYTVVTDWYWICHGRAPDSGGLNYWVGQLNSNDNHNVIFSNFVSAGGCPSPAPRCTSFSASPATIFNGASSTLSWGSQYGQNFGVSPNIGAITTASGSRSVSPSSTQTYTFVVTNPNGTATCSATVTVRYRFTDNRPNVPSRFSWSNGTYCGGGVLLHDRVGWLSPSGNTSQESTTVSAGQNSVPAQINLVGRVCTADDYSNADTNDGGRVKNRTVDGDAAYIRSTSISSSPNIPGLSSTLQGKSLSISRSGQYSTRPGTAWTSIASSSFSIDGIGSLSPGTYNITITAEVVYTALANGNRVCVGDQSPTSSVVGTNCTSRSAPFTISIIVPDEPTNPPSPQCQMFGPNPSIIDIGDTASLGWSVTDASLVQLSINGVTTTVGHVVSGYNVSPTVTTQYFIIATDNEGERVTCSVTVTVRDSPPPTADELRCDGSLYQSVVTGVNSYEMRKLNIQENRYDPALGSSSEMTVNAIGYNIDDNYIYGIGVKEAASIFSSNERFLVRINKYGQPTRLNMKLMLSNSDFVITPDQGSVVGDFDKSGNLWIVITPRLGVTAPSYVYRIDVDYQGTGVARAFPVFTDNSTPSVLGTIQDWTYIIDSFYGVAVPSNGNPYLLRVPETATSIGNAVGRVFAAPVPPGNSPYGAAWTNIDGRLYVGLNTGSIYEIEDYAISASSPAPRATPRLINLGGLVGNDGASCPNGRDVLARVNYPFVRVKGSDVIAGSVFADSAASASCSDRRGLYPATSQGAIQANGYRQQAYNSSDVTDIKMGSSSAEYAVFALGEIDSGSGKSSFISNNGYYRQYSGADTSRVRDVAFANNLGGIKNTYGGFYAPGTLPCIDITKIEDKLPAVANATQAGIESLIEDGNGIYRSDTSLSLPELTLGNDGRVVLYVNGKVTITGNITGGHESDVSGMLNGAQLTIIATGGIDIAPAVREIDAYLLAHNNTLNTCSGGGTPATNICSQQLTVTGGLAGKKIEWRRNYGTLGPDETTLPVNNGIDRCAAGSEVEALSVATPENYAVMNAALDRCAAEFVDFDPSFYFANPFTLSNGQGSISGKPLNTTELPPVY